MSDEKPARRPKNVKGPPVAERVRVIADLMSRGEWNGYASRKVLSEQWGLNDATIRTAAAEASRMLQLSPEERDQMKIAHAHSCAKMQAIAESDVNVVTGLRDLGGFARVLELRAKFEGIELDETKKVELTGKDGGPVTVSLADIDAALDAAKKNDDPDDGDGEP